MSYCVQNFKRNAQDLVENKRGMDTKNMLEKIQTDRVAVTMILKTLPRLVVKCHLQRS